MPSERASTACLSDALDAAPVGHPAASRPEPFQLTQRPPVGETGFESRALFIANVAQAIRIQSPDQGDSCPASRRLVAKARIEIIGEL